MSIIILGKSQKSWPSLIIREHTFIEDNFHGTLPLITPTSFGIFYFGRKSVDNRDYRKREILYLFETGRIFSNIHVFFCILMLIQVEMCKGPENRSMSL